MFCCYLQVYQVEAGSEARVVSHHCESANLLIHLSKVFTRTSATKACVLVVLSNKISFNILTTNRYKGSMLQHKKTHIQYKY